MSVLPVRYKTHATTICRLGYPPPVPLVPGKKFPDNGAISAVTGKNWPEAGVTTSIEEVMKMAASCSPEAGIGLVMDGRSVFLDNDIIPPVSASPSETRRISNVSDAVDQLIVGSLGPTMRRHSEGSKRLCVYRLKEPHTVETTVGPGFEIFSTRKSKQVAVYGRHPSGNDYRWEDDKGPATVSFSQIPVADPDTVEKVRLQVISILRNEGLIAAPVREPLCPTRKDAPSTGASVSILMRELLQWFGAEQHRRPDEIAAEFLAKAVPGTRSNTLAAAISALVVTGFDDATIVACLEPVYRTAMAATGERTASMDRMVARVRQRLSVIAGADMRPLSEIDTAINTASWSVYRRKRHAPKDPIGKIHGKTAYASPSPWMPNGHRPNTPLRWSTYAGGKLPFNKVRIGS